MKSGQNEKSPKWKVVTSGQNEKCSKWKVVTSGQNEKWSKGSGKKVVKIKSGQKKALSYWHIIHVICAKTN